MAKLKFHGVFLLTLFFCTLTFFDVALAGKGILASTKLGKSNGKDLLPLRLKFKQEEEDCNDTPCETGKADDCHQKNCGACIEGYDICSDPPEDCNDIACTPPTKLDEKDECFNHEGCGYCDEDYSVCTFLYD